MPAKRCIVMLLALVCGLAPIACRRYSVVPPRGSSYPTTQPQSGLTNPVPPELLNSPIDSEPQFPMLQIPASQRNLWKPEVAARDWKHIVLHHTATSRGSVESIHEAHLKRRDKGGNPWLGIGYHFVIGNGNGMPDGEIEPTFRWRQQMHGAHAGVGNYNRQGIGIVLVGNFEKQPPTAAQLMAVKRLVRTLKAKYRIDAEHVIGHSDVKATACPGKYFPLDEVSFGRPVSGFVQRSSQPARSAFAELNRN